MSIESYADRLVARANNEIRKLKRQLLTASTSCEKYVIDLAIARQSGCAETARKIRWMCRSKAKNGTLVGWKVSCDDHVCITFASSRSAAKYNILKAARDAGYYQQGRSFPSNLSAIRAPEYDTTELIGLLKNKDIGPRHCWGEDDAKEFL